MTLKLASHNALLFLLPGSHRMALPCFCLEGNGISTSEAYSYRGPLLHSSLVQATPF